MISPGPRPLYRPTPHALEHVVHDGGISTAGLRWVKKKGPT